MEVKIFNYLHDDAKYIRDIVFVQEQGFVDEYDDKDEVSTHLVMYDCEKPVATCRFFLENEDEKQYVLGRFAVVKEARKFGFGRKMMEAAEECIKEKGGKIVRIGAQMQAVGFYEKMGYVGEGGKYYEQDCPHMHMKKTFC